jgi:hypothetical protein
VYGTCRTFTGSPWSGPFPPPSPQPRGHLAMIEGALFGGFSGTIGLSDCSEAHMLGLRPWPSPTGLSVDLMTVSSELSRFPLMELMHMPQVSDSGEPNEHSLSALIHIAFPIVLQGRHSRTVISELNTAPMHTPTNASPRHHWSSTHSSGPERIATPYSAEDLSSTSITRRLTSYSMPVLPGAFVAVGIPVTRHPPHRSQHALLMHWAPTSGV